MRLRLQITTLAAMTILMSGAPDASAAGAGPITVLASYGQSLPDGGALNIDPSDSLSLNAAGQIAFFSRVGGVARSQGIFVADAQGVRSIVRGCGDVLGQGTTCSVGDPTPIGGTFAGLSSAPPPAINVSGDVLFLADVAGGAASRGLFLYRAETATIVKVAAIGDAVPGGGILRTIGPGNLNDRDEIVFVGDTDVNTSPAIFDWRRSKLHVVVQSGDNAPGSGQFVDIARDITFLPDGTVIYGQPPDINNSGQIAFEAYVTVVGEPQRWGIFVTTPGGAAKWYVHQGDPAPSGGTIQGPVFLNPNLNDSGQIAMTFEISNSSGGAVVDIVGKPGAWRTALSFADPIDGLPVDVVSSTRNPQQKLDQDGNVILSVRVLDAESHDLARQVIAANDGSVTVIARQGDPAPLGGTLGDFDLTPSLVAAHGTLSAHGVGGPGFYAIFEETP